jgi:hypothetical protein
MDKTIQCHGFELAIQETEDGYSINIKGDKEKLKAKVEFIEAYFNYKEKARAAGIHGHFHGHFHGHHHKSLEGSSFLSHLHAHIRAMHEKKAGNSKEQE